MYLIQLIKKTYLMAGAEERKVVLDNFAALSVLQAVTYLLPVIVLPYLFRVLGPEKFGLVAFAQAFVQYFMIITDYGFGISATREISLCRHEHARVCAIFSSVMVVKLALAFISLLAIGLILYFVPRFREEWLVYLFSFGVVIGNTLFPVWFYQGTEKMRYISDCNIVGGIAYSLLMFALVKGPGDYLLVPLITSAVSLVTGLLGQYLAFSRFRMTFKFPGYVDIRQQLKAGWHIFISNVAINAYTNTRVFAIGMLTNNTLTGLYTMAERIANFFQTFPLQSFTQAVFPRLSKIYHRNGGKAYELMRKIQHITLIASLVLLPLAFLFSPLIVRIATGGDYPATVLSLRLLLFSVLFVTSNAFRVQFLLVSGRTGDYARIHVGMALLGLPLLFLCISASSYVGAAAATVAIEAGIFCFTWLRLRRLPETK